MAAGLSETRETSQKPSLKDRLERTGRSTYPPKPGRVKTTPPTGVVSPVSGGAEAFAAVSRFKEWKESGDEF
ncbi:hypothetical protein AMJ97_CH00521 [Rhizobium sp. N1314]|nr:hypothetical protein AMJ97_CH00521 [Rhizobium sp. N1314]